MTEERIRLPRRRQLEIANMARSLRETIPVHAFNTARAENLVKAAAKLKEDGMKNGLTTLMAWILVDTLKRHPQMCQTIDGEDFVVRSDINLGVAVSTTDGSLSVPVVQAAQKYNLRGLGDAIEELAVKARVHKLNPADVKNGVFTLSNMGRVMKGGQGAGIIPLGNSGMIAVGSVIDSAVVDDGVVVAGKVLPLTLTFDHRVANGVAAWQFFADFINAIEEISL